MLHFIFGTNYPPPLVSSPQKQLMPAQCHSRHLPYLINNFLSIPRHLFTLSFPPLAPSITLLSTFSTSCCDFLEIWLRAREYTNVSWFYEQFNLLLYIYIYLSIYLFRTNNSCSWFWIFVWSTIGTVYMLCAPSYREFNSLQKKDIRHFWFR